MVFKPIVGSNSVLLLDGARHKRERKLLMPPFHGERMWLYGDVMGEAADRSVDDWPVGTSFPLHARMQQITLDIILRTVFVVEEGARLARLRALLVATCEAPAGSAAIPSGEGAGQLRSPAHRSFPVLVVSATWST